MTGIAVRDHHLRVSTPRERPWAILARSCEGREQRRKQIDSERARRERTAASAKGWVEAGSVAAAMAQYGIEPARRDEADTALPLQELAQTLGVALDAILMECSRSADPVSHACLDATSAFVRRWHGVALGAAGADTALRRLQSDYGWLLSGPLDRIKGPLEALAEASAQMAAQQERRLIAQSQQAAVPGSWKPVALPEQFYRSLAESSARETSERDESQALRNRVNAARLQAGLPCL